MAGFIVAHPGNSGKRLPPVKWAALIRFYERGHSAGAAARKFGLRVCSVLEGLRRKGVAIRGAHAQRRLNQSQWLEIVGLYGKGVSGREIASRFGVDPGNVIAGLRRRGIKIRHAFKNNPLPKKTWACIVKSYSRGKSATSLAVKYGINPTNIISGLKRREISIRGTRKFRRLIPEEWAEASRLYKNGLSAGEIAERFGRSRSKILDGLRRHHVRIRDSRKQHRLSKREWSLVKRMYLGGHSASELSRKFNVDTSSIIGGLERKGVATRKTKKREILMEREWHEIVRLYAKGASARQVASAFFVPHSTILTGLRKRKLPVRVRVRPRIRLSSTETAYIAGLFDGEGCIVSGVRRSRRCYPGTHVISIQITNTVRSVLEFVQRKLKGRISLHKRSPLSLKPVYYWTVSARHAALVLRILLPFLKIKKERAELALKLNECIRRWPGGKLTKREIFVRSLICSKIKSLNGRGVFVGHPEEENKRREYLEMFKARNEKLYASAFPTAK